MKISDLVFRKASAADHTAILDLYRKVIAEMRRLEIDQWDEIYPANDPCIDSDILSGNMFVFEYRNRMAGVFVLDDTCDREYMVGTWKYPDAPFLTIHRFCVHPDFQHLGIGTQAMCQIEQTARERNVRTLRLDVYSMNPYSMNMYTKLGFIKVGQVLWRKGIFYLMEKVI
jgi:GNAT superfamily N-acetyltransferase